jgi:signal transduction histidine kinase
LSEATAQAYARDLEQSINQLQQTQAQLVQTEKIASLGQLVAGVAHEVNNPVSFISGNLSHLQQSTADLTQHVLLYQRYYPEPVTAIQDHAEAIDLEYVMGDLPQAVASMRLGTDRIGEIMQSLRNYSRIDGTDMKAVDLHEGIDATLIILSHRFKAGPKRPAIQIVKQFGDLPLVKCYPGQLNQVFTNLIANAIDALEESNLGKTYHELEQSPNVIKIQTSFEHDYATISISDNGLGIPESVQENLFQSFFTTKPKDKGTGLGLSISHQIVTEKHGGTIDCISAQGQGTTFIVRVKYD